MSDTAIKRLAADGFADILARVAGYLTPENTAHLTATKANPLSAENIQGAEQDDESISQRSPSGTKSKTSRTTSHQPARRRASGRAGRAKAARTTTT